MDLDLSRIDPGRDWPRAVERAIVAAEDGTAGALLPLVASGSTQSDLADHLLTVSAVDPLVQDLTTTPSGKRLAEVLVATSSGRELIAVLVDGPIATELAGLLAKPDQGGPLGRLANSHGEMAQVLARHLIDSQSVRSEAEAILRPQPGRASARDLLDHVVGQRLAERLGRDDAGLSLLDYLAKRPAVRHLALTLIADRANHDLARSLAGCRAAHRLTSLVIEARDRGPIAEALVMSRAGRAIGMSLQDTTTDRQFIHDLANDAAGQRLAAALSGATEGPFADRLDEQLTILRLVVTIALLLILVMEPLAVAALCLMTAGVAAISAGPRPAAGSESDDGIGSERRQVHLRVDVGPGATMTELGQILTDLDILVGASMTAGPDPAATGDGPTALGPGGSPPVTLVKASYRDPLEIELTVADDADGAAQLEALERLLAGFESAQPDPGRAVSAEGVDSQSPVVCALDRLSKHPVTVQI